MKTIGYAIVGTGYFGAELGRIMKEQEGAKIVAVYDPENAETVAKELGCDVETDLDKLCSRDDVDAVLVASPNYLHKESVLVAARHKKHVFCEKPIALCYADCDEMVRACKENGVIFMAGHVMNFFRAVRHTAVHQLEEDPRKIRWSPLSPYPRAGLHPVPDGTGNRGYHDWRQCCA